MVPNEKQQGKKKIAIHAQGLTNANLAVFYLYSTKYTQSSVTLAGLPGSETEVLSVQTLESIDPRASSQTD